MGNPCRTRKRVHAVLRAPDGSAFQKCDCCGSVVAVALADMHGCEDNKENVKRFKGVCRDQDVVNQTNIDDQPRSPFSVLHVRERFTMENKNENLMDIDRKGFETWKAMSKEEKQHFVVEAKKVNSAYTNALEQDVDIPKVSDEADSAMVGKYDELYEDDYISYSYESSLGSFDFNHCF